MIAAGEPLLELALGAGVGFTIGLTGVGGGVLVVPALCLVLGLPATTAVGTASAFIFLTSLFACGQHLRAGNVDLPLARRFLVGALPGNIAACLAIAWLKHASATGTAALQTHLRSFIIGVMAVSAVLVLADLGGGRRGGAEGEEGAERLPLAATLALGTLIGAIIGATSIGGGVVLVPLLMLGFGLPARRTVGTSSCLALVLTGSTAILSAGRGDVHWGVALLMAAGSLVGVCGGVRLGRLLPERPMRAVIAGLLAVAIGGMVWA